jgi:hypothetical protein
MAEKQHDADFPAQRMPVHHCRLAHDAGQNVLAAQHPELGCALIVGDAPLSIND